MPVIWGRDICPPCVTQVDAKAGVAHRLGLPYGFGGLAGTATRGVCSLFWEWGADRSERRCVRCGRERDWNDDGVVWGEPIDLQEMQAEFRNALEFTREALAQQPSGPEDPRIIPHIIAAMAGDRLVTFGRDDGKAGSAWHLLHSLADDLPQESSEWDLTLSAPPSWCVEASAAELLASTQGISRFRQEAQARIAASLGVERDRVQITAVTEGSVHVKYTVADLTRAEKERLLQGSAAEQLRSEFDTFVKLDISPAVLALHFNLSDLDARGDKSDFGQTFEIGPPGRTRTYHQPIGWSRYGFKVLGKYDDDAWLTPFQGSGNWYRAFHGTRNGREKEIVQGGFRQSWCGKLGSGVYVSPLVGYAEGYCRLLDLNLSSGRKQFKCVLQVAVRPDGIVAEGFPDRSGTNQE